ncbi:DUF4440 domain-containing protein [Tateyamaria sp.]|uniref:DUF4440 domain-containing protein n=1 Tax=Tateyamaria sp. TaxID=1929288 RepID=UPI003B21B90A
MTSDPNTPDPLLAELCACESAVWDALVRGDTQADAAALDDSFLGVYADGFAGKAEHVGQLAYGPTVASFSLTDMRARPLGDGHALLSYLAEFQRVSSTQPEKMYVSSIWKRTGAGWINVFSQDTAAAG